MHSKAWYAGNMTWDHILVEKAQPKSRQAYLLCKLPTEGVEGVLQALTLLAVWGDDSHPSGLQPLLLLPVRLQQHIAQLKEQCRSQICLIL